jgi:hypothetical protein
MIQLSHATFSALGCLVEIDGWTADIDSKRSLLLLGLCNLAADDADDQPKADALSTAAVDGDDVLACNEPRLVDLAMRYRDWLDDPQKKKTADWAATPADIAADDAAASLAVLQWLAKN